jgi:hypothetical protein
MSEKNRRLKDQARSKKASGFPHDIASTWAKTPAHEITPGHRANRLLELADTSLDLWQMKPKKAKAQKVG